jgi:serine acetyltransferase
VTKDVPPFAVVAGNPAKIIKYRFTNETMQSILQAPWWNNTIEELSVDLDKFIQPLEGIGSENK